MLNDYSLSFFDASDNFKFEKTFQYTSAFLHSSIFYVEFSGDWITTDQGNNLFLWNIAEETYRRFPERHK